MKRARVEQMDRSLKRFARRIILVHLLLLLGVLALVIGASRAVYKSAQAQAQSQISEQLDLLGNQTASGLRGYYDAIFSDLELFKPVDPDSDVTDDRPLASHPLGLRPPPRFPDSVPPN